MPAGGGRRVGRRKVTGDDLVHLLLRVRLQSEFDFAVRAASPDDDSEPSGLARVSDQLLEVALRGLRHRLPVDGDEPVSGAKAGTPGRALLGNGFDHQSRLALFDGG